MALTVLGLLPVSAAELGPDPYVSTWVSGSKSKLRLIAAPFEPSRGIHDAGVEIELAPGTLTYWRMPGNAGIPPIFSFAGSENLRDVEVRYPAPTRIDEAGTDVYGYLGKVIFPLHVAPVDAARPVTLAMTLTYAVCERVCVPARAAAKLSLPARAELSGGSPSQEAAMADAEAKVPLRLSAAERDAKITIGKVKGTAAATWRLGVKNGSAEDLFAEAPDGWYFETSKSGGANEFLIVAAETPTVETKATVPVVLTLTDARQSYEFAVDLDAVSLRHENAAWSDRTP